ncbi:helix-turn-helix transcriptional regulator [Actinomycetospora lutea]|uniref:helix-turn-helix domain-containing protein n=1 Tax=Actinomycetospora lutea TaxID=663604 RepID=UPI0023672521|nr:helix-turn-helix transcriptional regulator [Actinomycetospora lutea]MDD7938809.1 helix-turn-helix transcriptional regulator [Actinomycetospora lutea]
MATVNDVLDDLGARLATRRRREGLGLAELSERTGISTSTLSRLEHGGRRATLELLLPLATVYGTGIDELIGIREATPARDAPVSRTEDTVMYRLSRSPGQPAAYKFVFSPARNTPPAELPTHQGWEWVYVLAGRLRVINGDADLLLRHGEATEIDTRRPHWLGTTGGGPVELALFGRQGERVHMRA